VGIDPDQLNQVLAQRLGAVVPDGFHIEAAEGMLRYSADTQVGTAGTYVRDNFAVHGETDEERAGGVTAQALDELQDYISEATRDPWPGQRAQPQARAQVRDGVLFAWYEGPGSPSGAVLEMEPVPLADLQRHSGYDQDSESLG
jgi:hypothetical protein